MTTGEQVFVSYRSEDRTHVERIAAELERANIKVWMDKESLLLGDPFPRAFAIGMERSTACLFFVGPHGSSPWTSHELDLALLRVSKDPMFRVIPVVLPGVPREQIPPSLEPNTALILGPGSDPRAAATRIAADLRRRRDQRPEQLVTTSGGIQMGSAGADYRPPSAGVWHLSENEGILRRHLRDLSFTPVLGPGCALIGRSSSPAWLDVASRMRVVQAALKGDLAAELYVQGLAHVDIYDVPLERGQVEGPMAPTPLLDLQLALAKLGASLGKLFASTMLSSGKPVWDTVTYHLHVSGGDSRLREAQHALSVAARAAHTLHGLHAHNDESLALSARGIYFRLVELVAQFLETDEDIFAAPFAADVDLARKQLRLPYDDGGSHELSLHQLEWIADALWHTFRYNVAAYPRTDELAFQISLLATGARGRRPELVSAAEIGKSHRVLSAETVASLYRRYSSRPGPEIMRLHDAIARALAVQFDGGQSRPSGQRGGQAVAFSTAYDLELENALHRNDGVDGYHVVVPVNAYLEDGPEARPEARWLLGTIGRRNSVDTPQWEWWSDSSWEPNRLRGPVVIKQHGSPLHKLPAPEKLADARAGDSSYSRIEHALVLSESDYLHDIARLQPLPEFFSMVLQQERALFFLGHSIRDWPTHLRLFSHVYPGNSVQQPRDRVAITRSHDPYRTAVLSALGIHRFVGSLEDVTRVIESSLP